MWELAMKPAFSATGKALLSLMTFGNDTIKDSVYAEIARGLHEGDANQLIFMAEFVLLLVSWVMVGELLRRWARLKEKIRALPAGALANDLRAALALQERKPPPPWLEDGWKHLTSLRRGIRLAVFLSISMSVLILALAVRSAYVNGEIAWFEQCVRIARPAITDLQERELRSAFAMSRNRDDFAKVLRQAETYARARDTTIKFSDPW